MRKNQVSIKIQRFGDQVPENFKVPEEGLSKHEYDSYKDAMQIINIYADSNNLYEALTAAFYEAISEIQKYEKLPQSGRRNHFD